MYLCDVSIVMQQIINRAGEGIADTDGAGHSIDGVCNLHRPFWTIIKRATKTVVRGCPTLSPPSPNPVSSHPTDYPLWPPNLHSKMWSSNLCNIRRPPPSITYVVAQLT